MKDELRKSQLRTIQYFFADGSFEFALGLLCLILAVFFYTETHLQGWFSAVIDGSLVLVMIGGVWLVNRLIRLLKQRLTYPRTGYVAYRRNKGVNRGWRMLGGLAAGGLVGGFGAVLINSPHAGIDVLPVFTSAAICLVLGITGWRASVPRLYLLAGLNLVTGILLGLAGLGNYNGVAMYYLAASLLLLVSGGLTLWRYLRDTRPQNTEGF